MNCMCSKLIAVFVLLYIIFVIILYFITRVLKMHVGGQSARKEAEQQVRDISF